MKHVHFSIVLAGLAMLSSAASAQANHMVTFEVAAINEISLSGVPSLTVNAATAGQAPTAAAQTLSWSITTNEVNKKVTVAIDAAMPSGVTLTANLTAPSGATSEGAKTLGTGAVDAVTAISEVNGAGLSLVYTLSATSAAGVVSQSTRTVTYTIAAGV